MINNEFLQSDLFNWIILPFLIFLARMCDVTLATLRNILLSKSVKYIVPFLGFIEVLIWLLAISQIMKNLHNPLCFFAYALGYSMGIFVGIKIEERLALGMQVMRIITQKDSEQLITVLISNNFGITTIDGHGSKGPVKIILTVIKRKDIKLVQAIIQEHNPQAFYSVEDIKAASRGVFPQGTNQNRVDYFKSVFPFGGGR
jgi:uncharacterized protein YebE (UPF0316 family)